MIKQRNPGNIFWGGGTLADLQPRVKLVKIILRKENKSGGGGKKKSTIFALSKAK